MGFLQATIVKYYIISNGLTFIGFAIMWKGWKLSHGAKDGLVTEWPYAYVGHLHYSGLFIVMIGMLIQWPTIITAVMFPVLVFVYYVSNGCFQEENRDCARRRSESGVPNI